MVDGVAVFLLERSVAAQQAAQEAEAEATKNTIPFAHLPIRVVAFLLLLCCVVVLLLEWEMGNGNGTNQHINQRIENWELGATS
jgi:hypothetical protein